MDNLKENLINLLYEVNIVIPNETYSNKIGWCVKYGTKYISQNEINIIKKTYNIKLDKDALINYIQVLWSELYNKKNNAIKQTLVTLQEPEEVPEVKVEVPEVKVEVPEVKVEIPEEVPEVKVEVPEVKVEIPEEVPEVKVEIPEEVPEVKVEVPEVKVEIPEENSQEESELKPEIPVKIKYVRKFKK